MLAVTARDARPRCTPLTKQAVTVLKAWLKNPFGALINALFSDAHGARLRSDAVQYLLSRYIAVARLIFISQVSQNRSQRPAHALYGSSASSRRISSKKETCR